MPKPTRTSRVCAAPIQLNVVYVIAILVNGAGFGSISRFMDLLGIGASLSNDRFCDIQKQILVHAIDLARESADEALAVDMEAAKAAGDTSVYLSFDGGWFHRRHSGEHFAVMTSERSNGQQSAAFAVVDYQFVCLSRVTQTSKGTMTTLRKGNSVSQTPQSMEPEALKAIMERISAKLHANGLNMVLCMDGDLSNHDVIKPHQNQISVVCRDFGHLRKAIAKIFQDRKNADIMHFSSVVTRWFTACVYTGVERHVDVDGSSSSSVNAATGSISAVAGQSEPKPKPLRFQSYRWTEQEFRSRFSNLIEHLQGRHSACPEKSACYGNPEFEMRTPHQLNCKDPVIIAKLRAVLQRSSGWRVLTVCSVICELAPPNRSTLFALVGAQRTHSIASLQRDEVAWRF